MNQDVFRSKISWRGGALLCNLLVIPAAFFLIASGCPRGPATTCGGLGMLYVLVVFPLLSTLLFCVVWWTIHGRVRALGLNHVWSLLALFWLFGSSKTIFSSLFFVMSVLMLRFDGSPPAIAVFESVSFLAFFAALIAYCYLAKDGLRSADQSAARLLWLIATAAAVHATLVSLNSLLWGMTVLPFIGSKIMHMVLPFQKLFSTIAMAGTLGLPRTFIVYIDLAIYSGALFYILHLQNPIAPTSPPSSKRRSPRSRVATPFGRRT